MNEKEKYKLEKKRVKAELKFKKKQLKEGVNTKNLNKNEYQQSSSPQPISQQKELPWYKNPSWIRAIIAIVSLIVMIIGLIIKL